MDMPSIICPICNKPKEYPREDWSLISRLPFVVCSRGCAWEVIENHPSKPGYLKEGVQKHLGQPSESYSTILKMFFRSEYERHVAETLHESEIHFEYELWSFQVKGSFYTPDFHLPDHQIFIEVKGSWGASAKSKLLNFIRIYPKVTLLVLPWTLAPSFYPSLLEEE
jgi:hypothetical protein